MQETVLQRKVAKLIQVEVSTILQREAHLNMGRMITLSVVRVTKDIEMAKIYASVFPENDAESVITFLNKNSWETRKLLAAKIRHQIRQIPTLHFFLDNSLQEVEKMEKILSELNIPPADPEEEEK
ncbi:MAG: 30S ribosome-binding factor RbfA [Bacteroidia bacterium]|nr:30S ribosome-binding factor RbfA [Bacteroidia bacterium]